MVIMCIGCIAANAQNTFTQRLQQSKSGEGKVTVSHNKAIDDLVNGTGSKDSALPEKKTASTQPEKKPDDKPVAQQPEKSDSQKAREELARIMEENSDTVVVQLDNRKKVMRGAIKVDGYRVQAFAGGNHRSDRQQAERVGATIKQSYPHEPIYVHFYSPRWICRVGNYRTYEEAHAMLLNIRKLGITGASIVKGKITVQ